MRIKVDFTLEIDSCDLDALAALAEVDRAEDARGFVRNEVEEHITAYLSRNGVDAEIVRTL